MKLQAARVPATRNLRPSSEAIERPASKCNIHVKGDYVNNMVMEEITNGDQKSPSAPFQRIITIDHIKMGLLPTLPLVVCAARFLPVL